MTNLKELRETIRQIKHGKPQPKFCPLCKSHNIYPLSILGILPTTYVCRDCGYRGAMALEIDLDQKEAADQESNDES